MNNGRAITRQADVEFDTVCAERKTVIERGDGVFRGEQRSSPMSKHQRSRR
jgi:hypothetical protein